MAAAGDDTAGLAGLSPNAAFLYTAVFKSQSNIEVIRRFFPVLRQWAETKKEYRGRVFTFAEVEEVISFLNRTVLADSDSLERDDSHASQEGKLDMPTSGASASSAPSSSQRGNVNDYWPRWALNKKRGVEILAPGMKGKPPSWTLASPVAIGYRGQKKRYLFVRAPTFEMDCRRNEVRPPGGGRTAEERLQELLARGDDPSRHPEWTDGSDIADGASGGKDRAAMYLTPGVHNGKGNASASSHNKLERDGGAAELMSALEDEMERMALLHRSPHIKTPSSDHPDPLSEPRAAAAIRLPTLTTEDILRLPAQAAQERLSSLQLETVCYAARRFRMSLPDGRTAGYVLGDGTGCGKGRIIASLLFHMWNSGHRRSVWVSATNDLYHDACRDLADLGADIPCVPMRRLPPSGPLDKKGTEANKELVKAMGIEGDGIVFLTYSLLVQTGQRRKVMAVHVRSAEDRARLCGEKGALDERLRIVTQLDDIGGETNADAATLMPGDRVVGVQSLRDLRKKTVPYTLSFERVLESKKSEKSAKFNDAEDLDAWNSRVGQLVAWLGADNARGLICFDEAHKAKNLVPDKDDQASTKTGLMVDLLQNYCPKAPVLYVSATAATEVKHLGYMSRLGLWGPGTAFEDFHDFSSTMERGGVGAMEMVAINAKAIGALSCKALAYVGTEFSIQRCGLTREQEDTYDASCRFWQYVLNTYRRFIESKELKQTYRARFFKKKKECVDIQKRLWQFLWGAQQRFFKAMCNSAKVPAAVAAAQDALAKGEQVVLSIWATGEARSSARMAQLKKDVVGRVVIDNISDGGLIVIEVMDKSTIDQVTTVLNSSMRLKSDVTFGGGVRIPKSSRLASVHGRRVNRLEELVGTVVPATLVFRSTSARRLTIDGTLDSTQEKVQFELSDDSLGERVIVGKVALGPDFFKQAELDGWHVKSINGRPVGKLQTVKIAPRLRKGQVLSFQDAIVPDHLSGASMIVEHFIRSSFLTDDVDGRPIDWAVELKEGMLEDLKKLNLPANAMDEILDSLGGLRKVAEMSGRSHRMKRRKDGSLAYVARSEELRCSLDGANMVEQVLFQKGVKKVCIVTEVASAGISLHADRRQLRKGFQPPRRVLISVELPWGADKSIQVFGRVHRANQLVPPRFITLCTPLGGEVRFISAIARRMKLLGAVTKGDRMTSMGGVADRHMSAFDVNNAYGMRALEMLYVDTGAGGGYKKPAVDPDLILLYQALPFLGSKGDGEATGRWLTWYEFAAEAGEVWRTLNLIEDMTALAERSRNWTQTRVGGGAMVQECAEMNRFFNRILMLEIHIQNAMFDTFFALYEEFVRVDTANGIYDAGVESLNQYHGRVIHEVRIESQEVLCKDPESGAETQYVRLSCDRGISWEHAMEAFKAFPKARGSIEGFYTFRLTPDAAPEYVLVKERAQLGSAGKDGAMWLSSRRKKQYVMWRADIGVSGGSVFTRQAYNAEDFINDARFERLDESSTSELAAAQAGWTQCYEASASSRLVVEHLLTGDVISAWRLVVGPGGSSHSQEGRNKKLQIVRALTQPDRLPVVGMRVAEEDVPHLKYVLACHHESMRQKSYSAKSSTIDDDELKGDLKKSGKQDGEGIRDIATRAAEAVLERLRALPEGGSLHGFSWLEVHKVLVADNIVPMNTTAMRGVQIAVNSLEKKGLIEIRDGDMFLGSGKVNDKCPKGADLELMLFPDQFVEDPGNDGGSDNSNSEDEADAGSFDLGGLDEDLEDALADELFGKSSQGRKDDEDSRKGTIDDDLPKAKKPRRSKEEIQADKERKELERIMRLSAVIEPTLLERPAPARSKRRRVVEDPTDDAEGATGEHVDRKPRREPAAPKEKKVPTPFVAIEKHPDEEDQPELDESGRLERRREMAKALFGDSEDEADLGSGS